MTNKDIFFILNVSLFLIFFFLLIGGYFLSRILFYSAKYQHESAIGTHMSPPSWTSLTFPFPSHPSRLLQSPCLSSLSHSFVRQSNLMKTTWILEVDYKLGFASLFIYSIPSRKLFTCLENKANNIKFSMSLTGIYTYIHTHMCICIYIYNYIYVPL